MNPQNFQASCLKTCEWYCMLNYTRQIETFWSPLFDDKSIWYGCIQDVEIKFASAINIYDNSIANLNARELFDHEHFRIFPSMMSRVSLLVHLLPKNCLGTLIIHSFRIFMIKIIWILPWFHIRAHLMINVFHSVLWNR